MARSPRGGPRGARTQKAQGPAARGGAAHLHVEFSQLPLKHLWVRGEGHGADICRGERERAAQVGADPGCTAVTPCATRGERRGGRCLRDPHKTASAKGAAPANL